MADREAGRPEVYEWRRPNGTVLLRVLAAEGARPGPPLWPFEPWDEPVGAVQVWRGNELIAETAAGAGALVVHEGGMTFPVFPPRDPCDRLP